MQMGGDVMLLKLQQYEKKAARKEENQPKSQLGWENARPENMPTAVRGIKGDHAPDGSTQEHPKKMDEDTLHVFENTASSGWSSR